MRKRKQRNRLSEKTSKDEATVRTLWRHSERDSKKFLRHLYNLEYIGGQYRIGKVTESSALQTISGCKTLDQQEYRR